MYTKKTIIFAGMVVGLVLGLIGSVEAQMRYWRKQDGSQFVGTYQYEKFRKYYFRGRDGKIFDIPTSELSDNDVKFIGAQGEVPAVKIKVSSSTKVFLDYPAEFEADQDGNEETEITVKVQVRKLSKAPYFGTLRGEVYLIGKEVATDHFRLFAKKGFSIEFDESQGAVFELTMKEMLLIFGEVDVRGAEYAGYVAVVEAPNGDILDFDSKFSFIKKENIKKLRTLRCPSFFKEELNSLSVPRPFTDREI
jgi:hypothetical protein